MQLLILSTKEVTNFSRHFHSFFIATIQINLYILLCLDGGLALQELNHASARKPILLEPVLERLFPFLHDPSVDNRALAHTMLIRCLKYNPKTVSRVVPAVYNCLHSDLPDIVESACRHIPELVVCSQGE